MFFLLDGVDFDRIDNRDLIGIFVKDRLSDREIYFILKIGSAAENEKHLIVSNPAN